MIRMGRSQTTITPDAPPQPEKSVFEINRNNQNLNNSTSAAESAPLRVGDNSPNSNRPFTDSEGMARDIKEGRLSGFVGSGTTLTGETEFKSMLRVDGHLVGRISSEAGTLHVGAGGLIDANITVAAVVVHGTINGDIIAAERIELGRTAKVIGNIAAPLLMIEQGAILEGNCSMMRAKTEFDKRAAGKIAENPKPEPEIISQIKPEIAVAVS